MISTFKMQFMGMDFEGQGSFGFDPEKEKYIGTWIDSMSPHMTVMEGTWDESTQTMTMEGSSRDMNGQPQKSRTVVKYQSDDAHVMTMFTEMGGKFVRTMEITYSRK